MGVCVARSVAPVTRRTSSTGSRTTVHQNRSTSAEHTDVSTLIFDTPLSFIDPDRIWTDVNMHNLRLLSSNRNPLHIIEGPEYRYYIGIVDFFMRYHFKQKVERILKAVVGCSCNHSTQPSDVYAKRWLDTMLSHVP